MKISSLVQILFVLSFLIPALGALFSGLTKYKSFADKIKGSNPEKYRRIRRLRAEYIFYIILGLLLLPGFFAFYRMIPWPYVVWHFCAIIVGFLVTLLRGTAVYYKLEREIKSKN